MTELLTIRDVANRLNEPLHRLRYALSEGRVAPAQRAGIMRLYREDQIPEIRAALGKSGRRELAGVVHA